MTKRIEELAKESGFNIYFSPLWNSTAEKFAELIVRECVKVVDNMADPEDSERYFWAMQNAVTKIQEHFGIEE